MKILANITSIFIALAILLTTIPAVKAQANDLTFTNLTVEVLDDAQVKINWSTNYPAFYLIEYGLTTNYGESLRGTVADYRHDVTLQNLLSEQKYNFRIIAYTADDKRTVTFNQTFKTTKNIDTDKPEILEFRIPMITDNLAYFHLQTNKKATTKITYWEVGTTNKQSKTVSSKDGDWAYGTLTGLKHLTSYAYTLTVTDEDGNKTEYNEKSFTTQGKSFELADFNITNITPVDSNSNLITDNSITIKFRTSLPAFCEISNQPVGQWGSTSTKELNKKEWEHKLTIDNLKPNTDYAYKIYCTDFLNKRINTEFIYYRTSGPTVLGYSATNSNKKIFGGYKFRLVRVAGDEKVYAVFTYHRYHIKNPATLQSYGLENEPIQTITQAELDRYDEARLIQNENTDEKYYIYLDMGRKKKINSDQVYNSYTYNRSRVAIPVNEFDLNNNYENVNLVKTNNSSAVYVITGNTKRAISSWDVFLSHGWQAWQIGLVNQTDLDSYKTGTAL